MPKEAQLHGFLTPIETLDSAFHLGVVEPSSGVKVPIAIGAYAVSSQTAANDVQSELMHASVMTRPADAQSVTDADFNIWGPAGTHALLSGLTTKVLSPANAAVSGKAALLSERHDMYEVQQDCVVEPEQYLQLPAQSAHGRHSAQLHRRSAFTMLSDGQVLPVAAQNPVQAASSMLELLHRSQQQSQMHTLIDAPASSIHAGPAIAARVTQGVVTGLLRTAAAELSTMSVSVLSTDSRKPSSVQAAAPALPSVNTTGFLESVSSKAGAITKPQLVQSSMAAPQHDLFQLRPQPRGSLANLVPVPVDSAAVQLKAGEVLVQVRAIGLNFRDVLNVLGMYPGDPGPPGADCAGVVMAVGPAAATSADPKPQIFKLGDAVFGIAPGSLGSCVVTAASKLVPMPAHLAFHEAATVPTVMVTGLVGLLQAAQVSAGDTVLVHAAAGGVGLAAIQLLQAVGANIIATAGSAQKRAMLHKLGVQHVVSSRQTQFVGEVAQLGGVDVVLNSLTSSGMVAASLAVLKPNGRFVEISKREIWSQQQVGSERPDCSFVFIAVDFLSPACIQTSLQWVSAALTTGAICPLPSICHSFGNAAAAFRQMMQASHVGKVVLTHPATGIGSRSSAVGSSLTITGGLGGLGLLTAKWAVHQAASPQFLTLLSRTGRTTASADFVSLIKSGSHVTARMLDVSFSADAACIGEVSEQKVVKSPTEHEQRTAPLTTLLHASGVLQDSMLQGQTAAGLRAALAPKVAGLAAMGLALALLPMQQVVLFSSVASLLGTTGQGNYAAANAGLDAWAAAQQNAGSVAKAIQWGGWSSTGKQHQRFCILSSTSYFAWMHELPAAC